MCQKDKVKVLNLKADQKKKSADADTEPLKASIALMPWSGNDYHDVTSVTQLMSECNVPTICVM